MKYLLICTLYLLLAGLLAPPSAAQENHSLFQPVVRQITYKIGTQTIRLSLWQYGDRQDLFYINLHDDEYTAVEAAKNCLQRYGGSMLKIENDCNRNISFSHAGRIYTFDPNRIFSREGVKQTLQKNRQSSKAAIELTRKFGQRILSLIPKKAKYIIALHNNRDGEPLSIHSYSPQGNLTGDAREVNYTIHHDPDDFFLTTKEKLYRLIAAAGFNAVWQDAEKVNQDGSLSVYYRHHKQVAYINCETEHGKMEQYVAMLQAILQIISV